MRPFQRTEGGLRVRLAGTERILLDRLAEDMTRLLGEAPAETGGHDPAVRRLLPDAYRDDEEASAEFRALTERELRDDMVRRLETLGRLGGPAPTPGGDGGDDARETEPRGDAVVLDEAEALDVARALGTVRIVLAERLDVYEDGDDGRGVDGMELLGEIYSWLGYLQDSLVRELTD